MPRNGSGVYSLPTGNPVVTGTTISSTVQNNTMNDVAAALTGSVSADGQTAMTGALNMGNNKITSLAAGAQPGDALRWQQLFSQGSEIAVASAATTDIGAQNSTLLNITGTTTITSFGTNYNGPRYLRFSSALTITNNATSLICPLGVNASVKAGDVWLANPKSTAGVPDGWYVTRVMSVVNPSLGVATIVGLSGGSDAVTPTTKFNLQADVVVTQSNSYVNVTSKTVDISLPSQLGGRDQAAAFANFAEPNLFFVPDGSGGLGLVASLANANTGPTGYTEWALAANLKLNGSAQIIQGTVSGSKFTYAVPQAIIIGGGGAFPSSVSTSNYVPANAYDVEYSTFFSSTSSAGGSGAGNAVVGLGSQDYLLIQFYLNGASQTTGGGASITLPQTTGRAITYGAASLSGSVATYTQSVRANRYTMKTGAR